MSKNPEEIELDGIPGMPGEELPEGERILWQGRPQWRPLARHAFKTRWLVVYFAVFLVARLISAFSGGEAVDAALQLLVMTLLFAACLGVVALLAWFQARSAIYTITTHRVVMHVGAALPITWNLPFARIAAADLTTREEGDGDIVLRLTEGNRVAWLHLWPHARRGARMSALPTLRAIAEPQQVAAKLDAAVREWSAREKSAPPVFVDTSVGKDTTVTPEPVVGVAPRLASEGN